MSGPLSSHAFNFSPGKTASGVFIPLSQLVIYLTAENRDQTKIVVGALPAPLALFVCSAWDSPT